MFFMGTTNAIFVALAVPLSSFLAFLIMPALDSVLPTSFTLNMMVLFSFLLALGIVVDDAIRSEEHTSELQSLMRISYAVFCLTIKTTAANIQRSATQQSYFS